jgi:hypothetical protein
MSDEKRDLFISFNSADKNWADWIAFQLKRKGYTTFYQHDDFLPGSDFLQEMNLAMINAKLTVAIWSKNYFDSKFASLEARVALGQSVGKKEIKLVPVKIDDCEIHPLFSSLVYIDLTNKRDFEAQKLLLGGIGAVLLEGKAGVSKKVPKFPPSVSQDLPAPKNTPKGLCVPKPLKVLYAGSKRSSNLDLESSYKIVVSGIGNYLTKGTLKFTKSLNLNTSNIFEVLLKIQPHIFHFTGKQDGGDIRITDDSNNVTTISDVELAGYLTSFGNNIKLAIIDTCYSYNCAKSISDVVDFAIGVKGFVYDTNADCFFKVFYKALCMGYSLKDAVGQATASQKFKKIPLQQIPILISKKGADPSKAYFVSK